jgi:hypothetical protein
MASPKHDASRAASSAESESRIRVEPSTSDFSGISQLEPDFNGHNEGSKKTLSALGSTAIPSPKKTVEESEKNAGEINEEQNETQIPPISFFQLFRSAQNVIYCKLDISESTNPSSPRSQHAKHSHLLTVCPQPC